VFFFHSIHKPGIEISLTRNVRFHRSSLLPQGLHLTKYFRKFRLNNFSPKKKKVNKTTDSLIRPRITSFTSPKPNSHWMWPHPLQTVDNKLSSTAVVPRSLHLSLFPPLFRLPVGVYSYVYLGICVSAILSIRYVHLHLQGLLHNNLI